jgi:hypothetical protein
MRAKSPRRQCLLSLAIAEACDRSQHLFNEDVEGYPRGADCDGCEVAKVALLGTMVGKNPLRTSREELTWFVSGI